MPQDYRILVNVLVGVSGLSYYSQCVGGCLRTRITVSVLVGASGLSYYMHHAEAALGY